MRLGDLDKAEAVLRNIADHLKECGQDGLWPATYAAADVIKQQRAIDAVPVSQLREMLSNLESKCCGDGAETYTTGYRNGHRNGQIELLRYILQVPDGTSVGGRTVTEHDQRRGPRSER